MSLLSILLYVFVMFLRTRCCPIVQCINLRFCTETKIHGYLKVAGKCFENKTVLTELCPFYNFQNISDKSVKNNFFVKLKFSL